MKKYIIISAGTSFRWLLPHRLRPRSARPSPELVSGGRLASTSFPLHQARIEARVNASTTHAADLWNSIGAMGEAFRLFQGSWAAKSPTIPRSKEIIISRGKHCPTFTQRSACGWPMARNNAPTWWFPATARAPFFNLLGRRYLNQNDQRPLSGLETTASAGHAEFLVCATANSKAS